MLLDEPDAKQDGAERDYDDAGTIHDRLNSELRTPAFASGSGAASLNPGRVKAQRGRANSERYFRHRVMPAITPRMTAADAIRRQRASSQNAARLNCLDRILRTGRRETAAAGRAEQKELRRRNRPAVRADGKNQNMLGWIHGCFIRPARLRADK